MRLVVIGGSGSSTPELFDALSDWPGGVERRPELDVVLVGRSADKLRVVAQACRRRVVGQGAAITVRASVERRAALQGADAVLTQVRVGGYEARAFDESFPWRFALPGEETMGPGGFANACRTIPALVPIWDDIAEVASAALVVNLTNPAGIVQAAAHRSHPTLRVVSVCDSPASLLMGVAKRLKRPFGDVSRRYVGMNHLGWYVPQSPDELDEVADLAVGIEPALVRLHGALPSAYVRYYVHPDRILREQRNRETRGQVLEQLDRVLLASYAAHVEDVPPRGALRWYRLAVLTLLDAWINGSVDPVVAGARNDRLIAWLPRDSVLEVSHDASRPGLLAPIPPPEVPALPRSMLSAHAWYELLAVDGAASGDEVRQLRALCANPLVRDADLAAALLETIAQHRSGPGGRRSEASDEEPSGRRRQSA